MELDEVSRWKKAQETLNYLIYFKMKLLKLIIHVTVKYRKSKRFGN